MDYEKKWNKLKQLLEENRLSCNNEIEILNRDITAATSCSMLIDRIQKEMNKIESEEK